MCSSYYYDRNVSFQIFCNSYIVGILANNGELDAPAAVKGAHFIRLCDIRGIPMIFLQHTVSDSEFLSLTGNVGTTAKARGQMMSMLSCSQVRTCMYVFFVVIFRQECLIIQVASILKGPVCNM